MKRCKDKIEVDKISREMQLLLLLSLKDISDTEKEIIKKLLKDNIDYELFLKMVNKHRVYPVVYKNLSTFIGFDVNETVIGTLEKWYKRSAMRSIRLTGELIKIADLLNKNNIRYVSMKGPALGVDIYGDISLRTSRDLDILVDRDDIEKVEEILYDNGYKNCEYEAELTLKQKEFSKNLLHHFSYFKEGVHIELHWSYNSLDYRSNFNYSWEERKGVKLFGKIINTLNDEENFLYLVFHGSKHGWTRLRWLCDIVEIIKRGKLDWTSIINKAKEKGNLYMVVQTLILANRLFQLKIPKELIKIVENNRLGNKLAVMAMPIINGLGEGEETPGNPLYLYFKKYSFNRINGIKLKSTYFLQHIYPSVLEYKAVNFRDKYFFMYFLVRPYFKLKRMLSR